MDITAVCISEKGIKVSPIYTTTNYSNNSWQVSKAEYDSARELCEHAGFVPGSLWKRKTNGVTMLVKRIKELSEQIGRLGTTNNKDPNLVLILQCVPADQKDNPGTGYAISELEAIE